MFNEESAFCPQSWLRVGGRGAFLIEVPFSRGANVQGFVRHVWSKHVR